MARGEVKRDRPGFKYGQRALLIGRNLPERVKREMFWLFHCRKRHQTNIVWLAHFLERPAHPHVACLALAAIGRAFKSRDGGGHRNPPVAASLISRTNTRHSCRQRCRVLLATGSCSPNRQKG